MIGSGHNDELATLALRRHAERISISLDDECGYARPREFVQPRVLRFARRMKGKRECYDGDGAGRRGSAARDARAV
jgi:hypothetical protein